MSNSLPEGHVLDQASQQQQQQQQQSAVHDDDTTSLFLTTGSPSQSGVVSQYDVVDFNTAMSVSQAAAVEAVAVAPEVPVTQASLISPASLHLPLGYPSQSMQQSSRTPRATMVPPTPASASSLPMEAFYGMSRSTPSSTPSTSVHTPSWLQPSTTSGAASVPHSWNSGMITSAAVAAAGGALPMMPTLYNKPSATSSNSATSRYAPMTAEQMLFLKGTTANVLPGSSADEQAQAAAQAAAMAAWSAQCVPSGSNAAAMNVAAAHPPMTTEAIPEHETFYGHLKTPEDALLVVEACRQGLLRRVHRRLDAIARSKLRSGSIYVFHEQESGIRRWTDGLYWSPSRVLGPYLVYRQLDRKMCAGKMTRRFLATTYGVKRVRDMDPVQRKLFGRLSAVDMSKSLEDAEGNQDENAAPSANDSYVRLLNENKEMDALTFPMEDAATAAVVQMTEEQVAMEQGAAAQDPSQAYLQHLHQRMLHSPNNGNNDEDDGGAYQFTRDGLIKKTITVVLDDQPYHVVAYYRRRDLNVLVPPTESVMAKYVEIKEEWRQQFGPQDEQEVQMAEAAAMAMIREGHEAAMVAAAHAAAAATPLFRKSRRGGPAPKNTPKPVKKPRRMKKDSISTPGSEAMTPGTSSPFHEATMDEDAHVPQDGQEQQEPTESMRDNNAEAGDESSLVLSSDDDEDDDFRLSSSFRKTPARSTRRRSTATTATPSNGATSVVGSSEKSTKRLRGLTSLASAMVHALQKDEQEESTTTPLRRTTRRQAHHEKEEKTPTTTTQTQPGLALLAHFVSEQQHHSNVPTKAEESVKEELSSVSNVAAAVMH